MNQNRPSRIALDVRGLIGADELFRLPGGVKRDPAVDAWLGAPGELRAIARAWFARARQCGADVLEMMHDGYPVACVDDAPFAYVNSFTHHVNVGFYLGTGLEDPAGLLEGNGKRMRHVKVTPGRETDAEALGNLISAAYRDIKLTLLQSGA
jgi:hypothetical protein